MGYSALYGLINLLLYSKDGPGLRGGYEMDGTANPGSSKMAFVIDWNTLLPTVEELVETFARHWTEELGNKGSDALRATWAQLFTAFREQIIDYDNPKKRIIWPIIGAATGAGKTQAMIFFFARLAALPPELHPGARLVTRRKLDADIIAKQINLYAKKYGWLTGERAENSWTDPDPSSRPTPGSYATSWHSDNNKKGRQTEDLSDSGVVVICHNGLTAGMEIRPNSLELMYMYNGHPRRALVIDEALDLCRAAHVTAWQVEKVSSFTPPAVRAEFPSTMSWLKRMTDRANKVGEDGRIFTRGLPIIGGEPPDLLGLLKAVKAFAEKHKGKNGMSKGELIVFEESIKALGLFVANWSWYQPQEHTKDTSISTAKNVARGATRGAIILDATARQQQLYSFLNNAVILPIVEHTRNYQSVTMHTYFGFRTGGDFMEKNAERLTKELIADLSQQITLNADGSKKRLLIVTHKGAVEDELNNLHDLAKSFTFETAHFHAVEGSNRWKDFEAVCIFGLPHRPPEWPKTIRMGMKGAEKEKWTPTDEEQEEITSIEIGQLSSDVIQCVNRGCCRKVTTDAGGCPEMDIYILLPGESDKGDCIAEAMQNEMPGINSVWWEYGPGELKVKKPPKPKKAAGILEYLFNMEPGTWKLRGEFKEPPYGMTQLALARITAKFRDNDPAILHLKEAGVYAAEITDAQNQQRAIFGKKKLT